MPYNRSFYPRVRTGLSMRLHSRTPEEELILAVFAPETVAVSQEGKILEILEDLTFTKLRTNIGAP